MNEHYTVTSPKTGSESVKRRTMFQKFMDANIRFLDKMGDAIISLYAHTEEDTPDDDKKDDNSDQPASKE